MSNSLQGCIFGETYDRVIHTGSSAITGNPAYTGTGTCIPYCFNSSNFDVRAPGVIRRDLTVNVPISGRIFGPLANTQKPGTCAFSKGNTITSGDSFVFGGFGNKQISSGTKSIFVNSYSTSAVRGNYGVALNALSSCISDGYTGEETGAIIGGICNISDTQISLMISGSGNRSLSGFNSLIINGINNTVECSTAASIFGGVYNCVIDSDGSNITTGCNNKLSSTFAGNIYTGIGNRQTGVTNVCTCLGCSIIGTGSANLISNNTVLAAADYFCRGEIYTGICNRLFSQCDALTLDSKIYNGTFNTVSGYLTSTIYNGCCNSIYTEGASNIINGSNNYIRHNCCATGLTYILNGRYNSLSTASVGNVNLGSRWFILNGECNLLDGGDSSTQLKYIYTGRCNEAKLGSYIYSGEKNRTKFAEHNKIFGGCNIHLDDSVRTCIIHVWGGSDHYAHCFTYGTIVGGQSARLIGTCANSGVNWGGNIIGGSTNTICSKCDERTIIGGHKNYICIDDTSPGGAIVGGRYNYMENLQTFALGSNLSSDRTGTTYVNNLIITDLLVGTPATLAGWCACTWYRCPGEDIIRVI